MKNQLFVAGLAVLGMAVFAASSNPAAAGVSRVYCSYKAVDQSGNVIKATRSHRKKMSRACEKARQKCRRVLDRKIRNKKFGRSTGCNKYRAWKI